MTRAYVEAPATHFRLKPETWAEIAEEYRNGATAKDLAAKWMVAPSSVYRYACRDGWTKKKSGDARARAHARMVDEEEAADKAMRPVGSRALKGLFLPAPVEDPDMGDAAALSKAALLASGRAMRGRLWNEAKALASLAESYARLAGRMGGTAIAPEKLPLETLLAVLENRDGVITKRCNFDPTGPYDAETEMKKQHIRRVAAHYREAGYSEFVVEAVVRDLLDTGPMQPSAWPPGKEPGYKRGD